MSRKKKIRTNNFSDLVTSMGAFNTMTGGSQLAGYGTTAFNNNYALITLNHVALSYLYTSNGIIQTAIELPTQDALSKGIELTSPEMDADDIAELLDHMERTDQWTRLRQAWNWGRLYGGAGLVINSNQDSGEPLNYRRLYNSPLELYDVDRWQLMSQQDLEHLDDENMFFLHGQPIHPSRVMIIKGKRAPWRVRRQLRGWGMSETERMIPPLNLYLKTQNVLYEIMDEAKVDVYRIDGLANQLYTTTGTLAMQKSIELTNQLKSHTNALVMDKNDEFETKNQSFGGLADVMGENRIGIASALRMPVTKLFGLSASGFNTGESDLENYNMMVESEIRTPMNSVIRKLIELNMWSLWGRVVDFTITWPTLRTMTAQEEQTAQDSKFNRAIVAYEHGLINSEEWGQIMQSEDILPLETRASDGLLDDAPTPPPEPTKITGSTTVHRNSIKIIRGDK